MGIGKSANVNVVVIDGSDPAPDIYGQLLQHHVEVGSPDPELVAALQTELHDELMKLLTEG